MRKGLEVNLGKTELVIHDIATDGLSNSKVYQCMICNLRIKVISVVCVKCNNLNHIGCAGSKRGTGKVCIAFSNRKCWRVIRARKEQCS